LLPLCKDADIVFTDRSDASIIFGTDNPEKIADSLHNSGVSTVVVKLGEKGLFASSKGETVTEPLIPTNVEDLIGAGDALAATFLAAQLKGWSLKESLHAGNVSVSLVATVRGDYENTPDLETLEFYLGSERGEKRHLR
jgi:2-dehydro-3-deoxygluconokinase